MSYSYGKFWIATKEDLKNVILREKLLPVNLFKFHILNQSCDIFIENDIIS